MPAVINRNTPSSTVTSKCDQGSLCGTSNQLLPEPITRSAFATSMYSCHAFFNDQFLFKAILVRIEIIFTSLPNECVVLT